MSRRSIIRSFINGISNIKLNLVFDGNSLTKGVGGGEAQYYPSKVRDYFITRVKELSWFSFGVSGQATTDMLNDAATQIDPLVLPDYVNIIIAWEDVNSILNRGKTALQNYNDMETYFAGRKAAGYNLGILVIGYYPRTPYNSVDWDIGDPSPLDQQNEFFDLVTSSTSNSWDIVVDLRYAPYIGGGRDQSVDSEYFDDSVHLLQKGYDVVKTQVIEDIIKLIN